MNTEPIDIILPWVNPNDKEWQESFQKYKEIETGDKCEGRFRDCDTLRYVLRSIAENCPWCRYVFLILCSTTQIPEWLNVNDPKLKIVYHSDFIPEKYLPTFNSLLIEMFYYKIKELSENFILINDDMFFCKKLSEDFFFINDTPVNQIKRCKTDNSDFGQWLKNSRYVAETITNKKIDMYDTGHLPVGYNKSLCEFIMSKLLNNFETWFHDSKFRQRFNLIHFIFYYIACEIHKVKNLDTTRGKFYFFKHGQKKYDFNLPMICLNESGDISENDIKELKSILKEKFKNTRFEK